MKKPEEGLHFCVNYWGLNVITVKNWYPLPLISETLNCLSWVRIFTKLNIIAAFNRLCIWEDNEVLITFCTYFSLFEYLVMPFGLCNSSASFQNYINDTLQEYLNNFCTVYLNDILIYCDSSEGDSSCEWLSRLTRALALVNTGEYLVLLALALFFLL